MNVIVIGKLGKDNLQSAITNFHDPSYRLELVLDRGTREHLIRFWDTFPTYVGFFSLDLSFCLDFLFWGHFFLLPT